MAQQYSPKAFFRHVPNAMLKRYFDARGVLQAHEFGQFAESDIEKIYQAWLTIPNDKRDEMELDFRIINTLACERGIKVILERSEFSEDNLAVILSEQTGFVAKAFWLFLKRPQYWEAAQAYYRADSIGDRFWYEGKINEQPPVRSSPEDIQALTTTLSQHFSTRESRGKNCVVEHFQRGHREYFFAYPEDYAQSKMGYEGATFKPLVSHPAFEVIFVYTQADGKISLYMKGLKNTKEDLSKLFADTILGCSLVTMERVKHVYDLEPLRELGKTQFIFPLDSGIQSVAIKKMRFKIKETNEHITLEVNPENNPNAIYELRDKLCGGIPLTDMIVTQVGIVVYMLEKETGKIKPRSFDVSSPNSCSLTHDDRDEIFRKMIADSGIEPR